ncbi:unnamed protein product [Closterium sp. Naga37s-1]|nr:unnamed protein product [Closterium sp. Naga37s-1]
MADDAKGPEGTEENRDNARETEEVRALKSTLRFLVSNSDAGSIIGKGGVVISEFQTQSGAKIVLSRAREYFPNTTDRIILLSGSVSAILTALHLILSKLADEPRRNEPGAREGDADLRIVVPNRVCGAIIGKGGATIRSFVEDSQATIKLSPQDAVGPGFAERVITIGGSLEQKLRAVALLLTKMSEDPTYVQYADVPLSYTGAPGRGGYNGGPGGYGGYGQGQGAYPGYPNPGGYGGALYGGVRGPPPYGMPGVPPNRGKQAAPPMLPGGVIPTTIIVAVPDDHVGAVVGKQGRSINEIQQNTGVRMVISGRNDFVEGTRDRKVTITGSSEGVVAAQHMIAQKVQQSIAASSGDHHPSHSGVDDGPPPGL